MTDRARVAVVDYGAGNLVSISRALETVGADVEIVAGPGAIGTADALVVPGVGAAAPAMARLERQGLIEPIRAWIEAGRPFLGICLGLQLLYAGSDEDGAVTLGLLAGRTVALEEPPTLPHIGWNQVERRRDHPILAGVPDSADLYFVHSYAVAPADPGTVIAETTHGGPFPSVVAHGATIGVQFHPERSGVDGLRVLANFVDLVAAGRLPAAERAAQPTVASKAG
jgi:imidazole glycerol-phosphate synthase subunit HisH